MGAGNITVLFYGVPLPDDRADVAYESLREGHRIAIPAAPIRGRNWIGARVAECDMLPKNMRDRVYPAAEASAAVDLPRSDSVGEARASWEHFAAWCKRRGVDLGTGGLYVVADYD